MADTIRSRSIAARLKSLAERQSVKPLAVDYDALVKRHDYLAALGIDGSAEGIDVVREFSGATLGSLRQMIDTLEFSQRVDRERIAILKEDGSQVLGTIDVDAFSPAAAREIKARLVSQEPLGIQVQPMLYTLDWKTAEGALEKQINLAGIDKPSRALKELEILSSANKLELYLEAWLRLHEPPELQTPKEGKFKRDVLIDYLKECIRDKKKPVIRKSRATVWDDDTGYLAGRNVSDIIFPDCTDFSGMDLRGTTLRLPKGAIITGALFGKHEKTGLVTRFASGSDLRNLQGWQGHETFNDENIILKHSAYNRLIDPEGQALIDARKRERRAAKAAAKKASAGGVLHTAPESESNAPAVRPPAVPAYSLGDLPTTQSRRMAGTYAAHLSPTARAASATAFGADTQRRQKSKRANRETIDAILSATSSSSPSPQDILAEILAEPQTPEPAPAPAHISLQDFMETAHRRLGRLASDEELMQLLLEEALRQKPESADRFRQIIEEGRKAEPEGRKR